MDFNNFCYNCMKPGKPGETVCHHCGFDNAKYITKAHCLPPKTPLNGKYILGRVLGQGGFGITYIGYDLNLQVVVAIKELFIKGINTRGVNKAVMVEPSRQAIFDTNKKHFQKEAQVLAMFNENDSEGIVHVKDYFEENGTAYIVMEYLDGMTLKDYVARKGPLSFDEAKTLLSSVCHSLIKVHEFGVIHKDVAPDNIMVLKTGAVKLMDFGGTYNLNEHDGVGVISYKRGYAPPEQYVGNGRIGKWTDIYSLAATLYFSLTGIKPADSMDRKAGKELPNLASQKVKIDDKLDAAIMRALHLNPDDRYPGMTEFYEAVFNTKRKKGGVILAILGVAVALVIVGAFMLGGDKKPGGDTTASGSRETVGSEMTTAAETTETPSPLVGDVVTVQPGTYIIGSYQDPDIILGIDSGFADNGAGLKLKEYKEANYNRIMVTGRSDDGFYNLQSAHTSSYLQALDSVEVGSRIIQTIKPEDNGTNRWQFIYAGEDETGNQLLILRSKNGMVLAPADKTVAVGTNLVLAEYDPADDSQKWVLSWNNRNAEEGDVIVYQPGDFVNSLSGVYSFGSIYDGEKSRLSVSSYEGLTEPELILWENAWAASQQFELVPQGNGTYKLYPKSVTGEEKKCVELDPETGKLVVRKESNSANQLFRAQYVGYNVYWILTNDELALGFEPRKGGEINGNGIVAKAAEEFTDANLCKWILSKAN